MRGPVSILFLLMWCATATLAGALEDGARIYHDGILPNGEPLRAEVAKGARLSGKIAACARCHRASGHGMVEGDIRVPDITAKALTAPLVPRRDLLLRELYQERQGPIAKTVVHIPHLRPAYAGLADLVRAVTRGQDPGGRLLAASMPRYRLNNEAAVALQGYVAQLGGQPDPGVEAGTVHFATLLGPDVPGQRAEAMLSVMRAFIETRNREIRREWSRPAYSPNHKALYAPSRRLWRLHIWRLDGPARTWPAQLRRLYTDQPVFALLGGAAKGDWTPLHRFCETARIPCLFPLTDWPGTETGHFTVYLSKGHPNEARLVAQRLVAMGARNVAQFHGADPRDSKMAEVFERALRTTHIELRDSPQNAQALVVWGNGVLLRKVLVDPVIAERNIPVFAAGALLADDQGRLPDLDMRRPVRVAWQYAHPATVTTRINRLRGWLRARKVRMPMWERTQLNTFLALDVTQHAMDHLVDRYSRELFLETIEQQVETGLNPGTFPRLSLGPGQRFAAHGAAILILCQNGAQIEHSTSTCRGDKNAPLR